MKHPVARPKLYFVLLYYCTVYSVLCTTVQCTVYSVQCTVYSVLLYSVQCTVYSVLLYRLTRPHIVVTCSWKLNSLKPKYTCFLSTQVGTENISRVLLEV